jgi:tRNA pseudouridine38-40 synthase
MEQNRYFIELAYKGTNYHGWQIQPNAKSVQETIENALFTKFREKIKLTGAGRTDTGVHASFYVAHFDCNIKITEKNVFSLNNILPKDIVIYKIYKVGNTANARFDAIFRTYKYFISTKKNPFNLETVTQINTEINLNLLNEASKILLEYTDFTSFSKLHSDTKTNNCKIFSAKWYLENNLYVFEITADRFLRNMVRSIVGTMININEGKTTILELKQIIEGKNRNLAGKSAAPEGLFLTDIKYT